MGLFGKKEETLDEMLEKLRGHMKNMTDEEKKKVMDKLSDGKVTTGEQVEKAKEDVAEEGKDSQTEKDRIDESVAAQEEADGNEDSQSAKDRVDESEGEEKALKEEGKADGEKHDEAAEEDRLGKLEARLSEIEKKLGEMVAKKGEEELPKAREVEEVTEDEEDEEEYEDFFKD